MIELRKICPADQEIFLEILTDDTVNKTYMLPDFATRDDAIPLFQRLMTLSNDDSRFVRCISCNGAAVGFLNDVQIKDEKIELGYVIHPKYHNKGYMTAALKVAITQLFAMGHQEVICGAFEGNEASMRVMAKSGMKPIPYSDTVEYRGQTIKCIYYAIKKPKYRCLVLDHDDTVVQTEKTLGYPYFCEILEKFRPGEKISFHDYVLDCHELGFAEMTRKRWQFTPEEQKEEYNGWMAYVMTHIPAVFDGIGDVIRWQKEAGGLICIVSHSSRENITRDYQHHFGIVPDAIYGFDLPQEQRKPNPYPLLDIMQKYQLNPSDILVVDDMKLAWKMASAVGVPIAFAAWGKREFPALSEEMTKLCDYSFTSPADLAKFLFD